MRHRVQKKKLNRNTSHRVALQRNLARSLILDGSIETTLAKAKFVQPYVEKLVTKAKRGNNKNNLDHVNSKLRSKEALRVLFSDLAQTFSSRNGGYTRIVKLGFRDGDHAPMARLEWVDKSVKKEKSAKVTQEAKQSTSVESDTTKSVKESQTKTEAPKKKRGRPKKTAEKKSQENEKKEQE